MKKYVGYIFAFVGYSIIILNLLVILNPALFSFLYFIYAMIVGFFWLKIAEWLGVRIVLFEKIIEYSDKNESFNKIKTYLKLDEQSENNKPDKNETGEFIDGAKKEIKTFANKTSNTVKTYSEVAEAIGRPRAARAVANAIGKNPHFCKIPCHRVIRSDGSLGGYSGKGGVKTKRYLLKSEGISF